METCTLESHHYTLCPSLVLVHQSFHLPAHASPPPPRRLGECLFLVYLLLPPSSSLSFVVKYLIDQNGVVLYARTLDRRFLCQRVCKQMQAHRRHHTTHTHTTQPQLGYLEQSSPPPSQSPHGGEGQRGQWEGEDHSLPTRHHPRRTSEERDQDGRRSPKILRLRNFSFAHTHPPTPTL